MIKLVSHCEMGRLPAAPQSTEALLQSQLPVASAAKQLSTAAFKVVRPLNGPKHIAAVKVPALHELVPDTVYPLLHVGWHVEPDANEFVHDPTPPLVGAVDASQSMTNTYALPVSSCQAPIKA